LGQLALIIFLCSLGLGLLSLLLLIWSGLQIYRTMRYAQKDSQAWVKMFVEYNRELQEQLKVMEKRAGHLSDIGMEMRLRTDDIKDVMEDINRHPLISAARFIAKHRGR
jgi:hypothetical protein